MFGTAILTTPKKRCGGRKPKRHDCGAHGMLTVTEIMRLAGISKTCVNLRLKWGWEKERLVVPGHSTRGDISKYRRPANGIMLAAIKLAKAFPDKLPTVEEIQSVRPMGRHCAVRWRKALIDAKEAA